MRKEFLPKNKTKVLIYLRNNIDKKITPLVIARKFKFSDVYVSKIIRRFKFLGLIEQSDDRTDGRTKIIKLTNSGISLADEILNFFSLKN